MLGEAYRHFFHDFVIFTNAFLLIDLIWVTTATGTACHHIVLTMLDATVFFPRVCISKREQWLVVRAENLWYLKQHQQDRLTQRRLLNRLM